MVEGGKRPFTFQVPQNILDGMEHRCHCMSVCNNIQIPLKHTTEFERRIISGTSGGCSYVAYVWDTEYLREEEGEVHFNQHNEDCGGDKSKCLSHYVPGLCCSSALVAMRNGERPSTSMKLVCCSEEL